MTREEIIRMAQEAGMADVCWESELSLLLLTRFAGLVAAAEREACAKVCSSKSEEWYARTSNRQHNSSAAIGADACAAAIRARGAA